ncbi:MAG: PAS domain S-box protein [Candidatus Odinarchaeota archaeon]
MINNQAIKGDKGSVEDFLFTFWQFKQFRKLSKPVEFLPFQLVIIMGENHNLNSAGERPELKLDKSGAKTISVLHVDDEEDFLRFAQKYLEKLSGKILEIDSLVDPGMVFEKLSERDYDVIIADYQMPGITGLDLLAELREQNNSIPFIILTGKGREEVVIQALNLGADYYLQKTGNSRILFMELYHFVSLVVERRRTENEIKGLKERYESLIMNVPEVIYSALPGEIGGTAFISDRWENWTGYSPEEIYRDRTIWLKSIHPEDKERTIENHNEILKKNLEYNLEYRVVHKETDQVSYLVDHGIPIKDENGKIIRFEGIITDITGQKQMENALRASEKKHRNLLNNLSDTVLEMDSEGNFTYVSSRAFDLVGYRLEEVIGKNGFEFIHPDDLENAMEILTKALEGEHIFGFEYRARHKDGHYVPISASGRMIREEDDIKLLIVLKDMTDQKQMEKALRERERDLVAFKELFSNVLDNTDAHIYMKDLEGNYTYINRGTEDYFKIKNENIEGKTDYDFFSKEKAEQIRASDRVIIEKGIHLQYEEKIEGEGQEWYFLTQKFPLRDKDNKIFGICGISTDIRKEIQAEEKLKKQKEELSQFAQAMTHDIKNSLIIIDGYAELLEKEHDRSHVEAIFKQSSYLKNLLDRSLTLAEAGEVIVKTNKVDLNTLVDEVAEATIPRDIKFSRDRLPTAMRCDREKLAQIFKNLFENAVTHGEPSRIEVIHSVSDKTAAILVVNNGQPIPAKIRNKIFDRGFSTRKESTGLGLAIVKKLVEAHDWQISLQSNPRVAIFKIKYSK